ncbi:DNA recombination protein RmuC [Spongisporangium articulatum]|uniref:DNA recombination protein RmuC n=1 Tax=Spongisporangium articulatum TaxID=3362603 RepID=A0ABW8ASJ3_9ACTN
MTGFALGVLFGAVVAAALTWVVGGAVARARAAGLAAERDLLRERVTDLEAAAGTETELVATLSPLSSTLQRVERQVAALERDRVEQFSRLDEQLNAVRVSGEALRQQTAALAGALRSPTARGAWGEVQLRRVVEHAGMLARVDFSTQVGGVTPEGVGVRPDLVVHLPGGKHLVVDAKAPLAAFLEASEQPGTESSRAAALHAKALRAHVDALAAKEYWAAFQPSPQLVVCFVPGEAFLASACSADPSLLEHAMGRRVVLATPTTLLALLRTVALTWQSEALAGNARALFELGRELHGRLGTLSEATTRVGRSLHRAVEDYNSWVGTLERRVLVTARRMEQLDLTDGEVPSPAPIEAVPRPLTAAELLDPVDRESA